MWSSTVGADRQPAAELFSPNPSVGRSRGEDFGFQVSITPTSTLEPTICVPDGMLVLWPSGAGGLGRGLGAA